MVLLLLLFAHPPKNWDAYTAEAFIATEFAATVSFTVLLTNDDTHEGNETVNLALSNLTGGGSRIRTAEQMAQPSRAATSAADRRSQPFLQMRAACLFDLLEITRRSSI